MLQQDASLATPYRTRCHAAQGALGTERRISFQIKSSGSGSLVPTGRHAETTRVPRPAEDHVRSRLDDRSRASSDFVGEPPRSQREIPGQAGSAKQIPVNLLHFLEALAAIRARAVLRRDDGSDRP